MILPPDPFWRLEQDFQWKFKEISEIRYCFYEEETEKDQLTLTKTIIEKYETIDFIFDFTERNTKENSKQNISRVSKEQMNLNSKL